MSAARQSSSAAALVGALFTIVLLGLNLAVGTANLVVLTVGLDRLARIPWLTVLVGGVVAGLVCTATLVVAARAAARRGRKAMAEQLSRADEQMKQADEQMKQMAALLQQAAAARKKETIQ